MRRHLQMLRLEHRLLAKLHGIAVAQRANVAERIAPLRVLAQREDGSVDVDCRIILHSARVRGGDLVIAVAIGLQHLHDGGQQAGALAIGQRAQPGAAGFTGKAEGVAQV